MNHTSWNHKQSVKEVVRHIAFKLGATGFLDSRRLRSGYKTGHLNSSNSQDRFRSIYQLGVWVNSDEQRSLSGLGSEEGSTASVRSELAALVADLNCSAFLDVGCGGWNWMREVTMPCSYMGVDIVPEVIEANRQHERPGVSFAVADAINESLPPADIAFCREVLFHLSLKDSLAVLQNIAGSAKWLIATTDPLWFNSDIRTGDFRMINLRMRPYNLPEPHAAIRDDAIVKGRVLGVWSTDVLAQSLGTS